MRKKLLTGILITFMLQQLMMGQSETYTVSLAQFSSKKYDEFSPVYYKKGIVFCTNKNPNLFLNYSNSQNKKQFKIYYINTAGKSKPGCVRIFSKNLKTKLNDGPATFNNKGDTIYYSRNLELTNKMSNISSPKNKLGIFTAVLVEGQWTKVREFRYNSERYNITSPCLSPDGKRLFFTSDKPGGYGDYDLYYCQWKGDYWNEPVNLGPVINTTGNESYPFINPSGDLFFSSDGQSGLGGMDIFFSQFSGTTWLTPFCLDPPINSQYDDFGIFTDTLMNEGYFSSNRNKSIDIYHFNTNFPQIFYSTIQKDNKYCFILKDTGSIVVDTVNFQYRWNFGDGKSSVRKVTNHYDYTLHHYNGNNQLVSTDFYGNDDILSSNLQVFTAAMNRTEWVTPVNGSKGGTITYEYNGNAQLVKTTYTRPSSASSEFSMFSYDVNNRINRQIMYWENKETGYIDYSYDGKGNLIKEALYNLPSTGVAELITTTQYVFDSQQNPFKSFSKLRIPGINTNLNNISKETYTINSKIDQGTDKVQVTQNSYAYNIKGYPISKNGNVKYVYE